MKQPSNLELALCAGLPWGLKGSVDADPYVLIFMDHNGRTLWRDENNKKRTCYNAIPHYFPLEYLTQEITISTYKDGKPFVPVCVLCELYYGSQNYEAPEFCDTELEDVEMSMMNICRDKSAITLEMADILHSWHFNVYNLSPDQFINAAESKIYEK